MTLNDLTELLQAEPYDGSHLGPPIQPENRELCGLVELRRVTCAGGGSHGLQSYRTARGELVALAAVRAANRQARKTKGICERVLEFLGARP